MPEFIHDEQAAQREREAPRAAGRRPGYTDAAGRVHRLITAEEREALIEARIDAIFDRPMAEAEVDRGTRVIVPTAFTAEDDAQLAAWIAENPPKASGARSAPTTAEAKRPRSSLQKLYDTMPPTGLRLYRLSRDLAPLNPKGTGEFDLGKRDAAKRLGVSPTAAWTYIDLHVKAGVWTVAKAAVWRRRGSGKQAASYRIVPLSEIDFEHAMGVYQGFRGQAWSRAKGLGGRCPHADRTPTNNEIDADPDADRTVSTSDDGVHTK